MSWEQTCTQRETGAPKCQSPSRRSSPFAEATQGRHTRGGETQPDAGDVCKGVTLGMAETGDHTQDGATQQVPMMVVTRGLAQNKRRDERR